jgi:hypothetical protein
MRTVPFGHADPAGDLGVGVTSGDHAQQFQLPGGQLRRGVAALFRIKVSLVQVGAQQCQQRTLTFGEVATGPASIRSRTTAGRRRQDTDRRHGPRSLRHFYEHAVLRQIWVGACCEIEAAGPSLTRPKL